MKAGKRTLALIPLLACFFVTALEAGMDPCRAPIRNVGTRFWIPLIGHGTDAFGNQFDTVFKVINLQATPASFSIFSCGDSGDTTALLESAGSPASQLDMSVPGRGTRTIRSLNADPANSLSVGWARIDTSSAIGVEVIFNIRDRNGFLTSTNVRVGILFRAATFFAEIGPEVNTGVAFLYPPEENAPARIDIDLVLRDPQGAQVAQTSIALNKSQKTSRFLGELLTPTGESLKEILLGTSGSFSGSVDVSLRATDPDAFVAILPLRQEGLVLTTQITFPARDTTSASESRRHVSAPAGVNLCQSETPEGRVFYVPLMGHGTDPFGNRFDTVFKIINLSNQPADVRLLACDGSGQMADLLSGVESPGPTSLIDFSVPPNGIETLRSLNRAPASALNTGWAVLTTQDFVGLEVIFNLRDPQDFLTSTNVQLFPIITATAFFADIGPAVNTGTAFMYPNSDDGRDQRVVVDLFLLDESGDIVAQTAIGLDKGQTLSRFLGELVPPDNGEESFSGSVEIRASEPVSVLPLRQEGLVLTTQALFPPRVVR